MTAPKLEFDCEAFLSDFGECIADQGGELDITDYKGTLEFIKSAVEGDWYWKKSRGRRK
jgi:hypothetical protein